jgi:transcriptional regulator with XRE-family HTH domain
MKPITFFSSQAGAVLKTMRQTRNLTVSQGAKLLNITVQALGKFESGYIKAFGTFEKHAFKYNFRVAFLVTDLDEEKKEKVKNNTSIAKRQQMDINGALNELETNTPEPGNQEPQNNDTINLIKAA